MLHKSYLVWFINCIGVRREQIGVCNWREILVGIVSIVTLVEIARMMVAYILIALSLGRWVESTWPIHASCRLQIRKVASLWVISASDWISPSNSTECIRIINVWIQILRIRNRIAWTLILTEQSLLESIYNLLYRCHTHLTSRCTAKQILHCNWIFSR